MAFRLPAVLPRFVLLPLLGVLATATITFAAVQRTDTSRTTAAAGAAPAAPLVVPDVSGKAYVFAKGILEDAGFAWRVTGPVRGYAVNPVAVQEPAAGTRVLNTGAPRVILRLRANPTYAQRGTPENASPYAGTPVRLADLATGPLSPRATAPAAPKPKAAHRPVVAPKRVPKHKARKRTTPKHAARPVHSTSRPPAFVVPGTRKEPLDEIPLPARARRLEAWLGSHPHPTAANVNHWLYQHAWIVTGAQFGWWHGSEALRILIAADRTVEEKWGIGRRSELVARAALARVETKSGGR